MNISFLHPSEDALLAYLKSSPAMPGRRRVASHLRECVRCQDTLRFIRDVNAKAGAPAPPAPSTVLERALRARTGGERRILPVSDNAPISRPRSFRLTASAAAVLLVIAGVVFVARPREVSAIASRSELIAGPARPHRGDSIRIRYRPSAGMFSGESSLVLRARFRMRGDDMYSTGVPVTSVRRATLLRRAANGEFAGSFVLPDSIDFVSMVVEDSAARTVDDNGGRLWEVLDHGPDGRPTFAALEQRMNDMMGRSWEEGYATAKQLTTLYPERFDSWSYRAFFERALYGEKGADSIGRANGQRADALANAAKERRALSAEEIGMIFFDKYARTYRKDATATDTADFHYWLDRMRREYPRHPQLAQYIAFHFTPGERKRPEYMLDTLEHLYTAFAPIRLQARAILLVGIQQASKTKDDSVFSLWTGRWVQFETRGDSAFSTALALVARPSLRAVEIPTLRAMIASKDDSLVGGRGLRENRAEYRRRVEDGRRQLFAALGRALIADGQVSEGVAALRSAQNGAWDPALFRSIRDAYKLAGDDDGVQSMRLRLAVDPRTNADSGAAIMAAGRARLGAPRWDSLVTSATNEMYTLMLGRSSARPLRGAPSLVADDGRSHTLQSLMGEKAAVVVFWSRHCGFALEALPAIERVAERMTREGKQFFFVVVDEPPSAEIRAFLADRKWTLPVYYDARGEMRGAFMSFGTPAYYVLDERGRIRFDGVDDAAELVAQTDAVIHEGSAR